MNNLYRKIGRRYFPVDERWLDPMEGVWLVCRTPNKRSAPHFMRLGDTPTVMVAAAFHRHREAMAKAIAERRETRQNSAWDLAEAAIAAVVAAEEAGK